MDNTKLIEQNFTSATLKEHNKQTRAKHIAGVLFEQLIAEYNLAVLESKPKMEDIKEGQFYVDSPLKSITSYMIDISFYRRGGDKFTIMANDLIDRLCVFSNDASISKYLGYIAENGNMEETQKIVNTENEGKEYTFWKDQIKQLVKKSLELAVFQELDIYIFRYIVEEGFNNYLETEPDLESLLSVKNDCQTDKEFLDWLLEEQYISNYPSGIKIEEGKGEIMAWLNPLVDYAIKSREEYEDDCN